MIVAVTPAAAQDATWTGLTGNYLNPSNWNPNLVPSGTATFGSAPTTVIQIGSPVSVGDWTFAAGAPAYTFNGSFTASFYGAGIGGSASITNNTALQFFNSSSAGAGSEVRFFNGWGVGVRFDGEFAEGAQSYAGTGTLRYAW